jgi:hypothetical protein
MGEDSSAMKYGPHTADAQEVIDLVESGRLLRDPRPLLDPDLRIIREIDDIAVYSDMNNNNDGVEWLWRDILNDAGDCGSLLPVERMKRAGSEVNENLRLLSNEMFKLLDYQLSHVYDEDFIAHLLNLVDIIIAYRVSHGRSLPFIERLFEMLKLGGFPCSWEGCYPAGRTVVYFPPAK